MRIGRLGLKFYCFYEMWFYIRKKATIVLFMILVGTIGLALMLCTGKLTDKVEEENAEYNRIYEDGKYSILADRFFGEVEQELKAKPQYWDILKEFNETLHSSDVFEYLEIREQYSEVFDYRGSDLNLKGYESGYTTRIQQRGTDVFSNIKALWLGEEVFEHFNLKVSDGRLFESEEFDYYFSREQETLPPVLMGSGFLGDYQVGDIIYVNNFVMRGEAQVIGFLEAGSNIMNLAAIQNIDRYLVFPMLRILDEPENPEDRAWFRSLYYEKNNGLLYSDIAENDIQEIVIKECKRLGIDGAYIVCGANNQPAADLGLSLDNVVKIIRYFAVGVSAFSVLILLIYLTVKIKKSGRYYAVLLINGFSKQDIAVMVAGEAVTILGLSGVFGIFLGKVLCSALFPNYYVDSVNALLTLAASGIIVVLVSLWSYWRVDISIHLREEGE